MHTGQWWIQEGADWGICSPLNVCGAALNGAPLQQMRRHLGGGTFRLTPGRNFSTVGSGTFQHAPGRHFSTSGPCMPDFARPLIE